MSDDDGLWSVAKTMDIKFDLREYVMNALIAASGDPQYQRL